MTLLTVFALFEGAALITGAGGALVVNLLRNRGYLRKVVEPVVSKPRSESASNMDSTPMSDRAALQRLMAVVDEMNRQIDPDYLDEKCSPPPEVYVNSREN